MELKEQIAEGLAPMLEAENLFLVEVKKQGKKVEIFADGDNGITISQCAALSRLAESHLDGSGLVSDDYELDVSSPGMSNPLRVPRQYKRRIGQTLDIVKTDGTDLEGILESVNDDFIVLKSIPKKSAKKPKKGEKIEAEEIKTFELKYSEIKRALLQFNWK
ncbi:MAG TPA: hypothetical protein VGB95_04510 [Chitinophagales bacterium]